ncbi:hypothetical protein [Blastochloris viridis]|uniref:Uncharacterized protein n=1 Tax=Blastochloris viridis TaxID=1079 RepID=A0A0H5B9P3_BLAVI|nr:hypothetical protein [Blastochloris viridis]ALK07834.1 hypothetical protein BVIR_16 [Blastochloris viridis]BAR98920.1 hypothetical protein BV133_1327 [Blastochloris viridis]CUU43756.1 hypothetical protein BVIRIDIS_27820 [Blastochloris viridis]
MQDPVDNMKARVRCPECRSIFRARIHRLVFAEPVACPVCRTQLRFHVSRHSESEDVEHYIRYVEQRTRHPHFFAGR